MKCRFDLQHLAFLAVFIGIGCGKDEDSIASDGPAVLIVDDGFDLSLPIFKNRVIASYTIVCSDPPVVPRADAGALVSDAGTPMSDEKARAIESLMLRDERCRLQPGLVDKPDPLASIARFKDRWNKMVAADKAGNAVFTDAERMEIGEAAKAGLNSARFHGSATASVIATLNPRARLVLVEIQLSTKDAVERGFTCLDQAAIDRTVEIYVDPDYRSAVSAQPRSTLDAEIYDLYAKHGIGIINTSFGELPRTTLENLQIAKKCAPVKLGPLFAARGELSRLRDATTRPNTVLVVRSAGNDGAVVNDTNDDPGCYVADVPRLTVGASSPAGVQSKFTNRGKCVDLYAPGEDVVGWLPGNWLFPLAGTSFSAPLMARLLSQETWGGTFTPAAARARAMAQRGDDGIVPESKFPAKLLYRRTPSTVNALTLEGSPPVHPIDPLRVDDLIDPRALKDLIAPLLAR